MTKQNLPGSAESDIAHKVKPRPLGDELHDAGFDGLPTLSRRESFHVWDKYSDLLNNVLLQAEVGGGKFFNPGGITPLDLPTTDGISEAKVAEIRESLAGGESFKALNYRRYQILMGLPPAMSLKWLTLEASSEDLPLVIWPKEKSERVTLVMLNELYQIACLELLREGLRLKPAQLDRVFTSLKSFDQFVVRLRGDGEKTTRKERVIQTANCAIVKKMLNVHDTFQSNKFEQIEDDAELAELKFKSLGLRAKLIRKDKYYVECKKSTINKKTFEWFKGYITLDKKTFESVSLKKGSNRKYGNASMMDDMFRMRFESIPLESDKETFDNLSRALNYFSHQYMEADAGNDALLIKQTQPVLNADLIEFSGWVKRIETGSTKDETTDGLRNAKIIGRIEYRGKYTGTIEIQFQPANEMETGMKSPEIYDLKKQLVDAARKLRGSIGMSTILFFVRRLPLKTEWMSDEGTIGLTEEEVINELFFKESNGMAKDSTKKGIEKRWSASSPLLLPVWTEEGGIRFIPKGAYSSELFVMYPELDRPVLIDEKYQKYILDMINRPEVEKEVETEIEWYKEANKTYENKRRELLGKYIRVEIERREVPLEAVLKRRTKKK